MSAVYNATTQARLCFLVLFSFAYIQRFFVPRFLSQLIICHWLNYRHSSIKPTVSKNTMKGDGNGCVVSSKNRENSPSNNPILKVPHVR